MCWGGGGGGLRGNFCGFLFASLDAESLKWDYSKKELAPRGANSFPKKINLTGKGRKI